MGALMSSSFAKVALFALCTFAAVSSRAQEPPLSSQSGQEDGLIRWSAPPHWSGGVSVRRSNTYQCLRDVIVVEMEYLLREGGGRHSRVTSVTIDGRPVASAYLEPINRLLISFATPPEIGTECLNGSFRLSLMDVGRTGVTRTVYASLGESP